MTHRPVDHDTERSVEGKLDQKETCQTARCVVERRRRFLEVVGSGGRISRFGDPRAGAG